MNELIEHSPNANRFLKEQLKQYAFDFSVPSNADIILQVQAGLSNREKLATLLEGELNFHGEKSGYATHDIHAFAAKFPPQLPRAFIRGLSYPGNIVLDPMMGSGTCIVEALLENRNGIGLDIDPLALRISQVKTTPVNVDEIRKAGAIVISQAVKLISDNMFIDNHICEIYNVQTRKFMDYWFLKSTQRELSALVLAIQQVNNGMIRRFLELIFSSIIITKSGGVSLARDLAHSRPHLDKNKIPRNAIDQFSLRLRKSLNSMEKIKKNGHFIISISGDARLMPFSDNSIDLIVTSPPYANAIDYMRAHKFSLVWLGSSIDELSDLRSKYIGSERVLKNEYIALPDSISMIVNNLAKFDKHKSLILEKYFHEMKLVLGEVYRVLKKDSCAIIIVGSSTMRGIDIHTHTCLADIASFLSFEVVGLSRRELDRNKRMMPARFGKKSDSKIEQRMHDEYVIGLYKP